MSRNRSNPSFHHFVFGNCVPLSHSGHDLGSVVCALRSSPDVRVCLDRTGRHFKWGFDTNSEKGYIEAGKYQRLVGQYFETTFVYAVREYIRNITHFPDKTKERQEAEERSFIVFPDVIEPPFLSFLFDASTGGCSPSSTGLRTNKNKTVLPYVKGTRLVLESSPLFGLDYDSLKKQDGLRRRLSIFLEGKEYQLDQDVPERIVGQDGDINLLVTRLGNQLDSRVVKLLDHGVSLLEE